MFRVFVFFDISTVYLSRYYSLTHTYIISFPSACFMSTLVSFPTTHFWISVYICALSPAYPLFFFLTLIPLYISYTSSFPPSLSLRVLMLFPYVFLSHLFGFSPVSSHLYLFPVLYLSIFLSPPPLSIWVLVKRMRWPTGSRQGFYAEL